MARITVEDCLEKLNNRFELTLLAAKRARQLVKSGEQPMVPWENDKCTVVALREIADGLITEEILKAREKSSQEDALATAGDMLAQAASSIADIEVSSESNFVEIEVKSVEVEASNEDSAGEAESSRSDEDDEDKEDA